MNTYRVLKDLVSLVERGKYDISLITQENKTIDIIKDDHVIFTSELSGDFTVTLHFRRKG